MRLATNALTTPGESYLATFCRLDVLAMGGLVAMTIDERASISAQGIRRLRVLAGGFAAATVLLWITRQIAFDKVLFNAVGVTIVDGAAALLVGLVVVESQTARQAWLRWRPLVWLGKISYGVYLLHYPIFLLTRHLLPTAPQDVGWRDTAVIAGVAIISTLAVAALSWVCFERPILRLKRAFA